MSLTRADTDTSVEQPPRGAAPGHTVVLTLLAALGLVVAGIGAGWLFWESGTGKNHSDDDRDG